MIRNGDAIGTKAFATCAVSCLIESCPDLGNLGLTCVGEIMMQILFFFDSEWTMIGLMVISIYGRLYILFYLHEMAFASKDRQLHLYN